jgi:hypothetical protein
MLPMLRGNIFTHAAGTNLASAYQIQNHNIGTFTHHTTKYIKHLIAQFINTVMVAAPP